ncbi:hypothetical protein Tco_1236368 [Tanacetum coccineum]
MNPLAAQQERKPRKDRGTRRGRHSTSSSFAFDQPSSSHLNDDDDDDGNGEGTSRASTPSPIRYVNLTQSIDYSLLDPATDFLHFAKQLLEFVFLSLMLLYFDHLLSN